MDEYSNLAEKAFNGDFPELPKRLPEQAQTQIKSPAESSKINLKNTFFEKYFPQNKKQLHDLFFEINFNNASNLLGLQSIVLHFSHRVSRETW